MSTATMPAQKQERQPGIESRMRPRPDYEPKYPGVGKLKGKVALITGGDSGIGRAVAVAMAREGARIAIVYLEEHKDANETRELVRRECSDAIMLSGDVGDESFCRAAVDATIEQYGRLDILVNNAAEQHKTDDPREIKAAQIERTFRTNVFSFFYIAKHALPHMREGATIINTTSITAYRAGAASEWRQRGRLLGTSRKARRWFKNEQEPRYVFETAAAASGVLFADKHCSRRLARGSAPCRYRAHATGF